MPNWCYTTYHLCGDKHEIQELYSIMKQLEDRDESFIDNDFGKTWVGNLVASLGEDWQNVYCRGCWYNLDLMPDGDISVGIRSAWREMRELRHFIREKFPSIKAYFMSYEPGMCIFQTNDADGRYFDCLHEVEVENQDTMSFATAEEAQAYIEEIIGRKLTPGEDPGTALGDWAESHRAYASYNVYQVVAD